MANFLSFSVLNTFQRSSRCLRFSSTISFKSQAKVNILKIKIIILRAEKLQGSGSRGSLNPSILILYFFELLAHFIMLLYEFWCHLLNDAAKYIAIDSKMLNLSFQIPKEAPGGSSKPPIL